MGGKKKSAKKSKSKPKKIYPSKHVEQQSPNQEVPGVADIDEDLQFADAEVAAEVDEVPALTPGEEVDVESEEPAVEEAANDQEVPETMLIEETPSLPALCHKRIERLKESEFGSRNFARRKLSLQSQNAQAAKQETRRVSLADAKQIKHPLQDTWTFWYYMGNKCKQWNENLRQVCKISTVEDFWCLYNELVSPTQLSPGKDFSFFKRHIRPEWEDSANKCGGLWSFCPREKNQKSSEMDRAWLEILMYLIGDQFDQLSRYINGVSYSKRKAQDRISLWVGTELSQTEEILRIGNCMKQAIGNVTKSFKLEYSTSDDWKQKTGSTVTIRHSL